MLDRAFNIYVTGWFSQSLRLGTTNLTARGYSDILVAKLPTTGPPLSLTQFGTTALLLWPTLAEGFSVETTMGPLSSAAWSAELRSPIIQGHDYTLSLPISTGQRLYRLKKH